MMNEQDARELLLKRSNAFHDRYFKAYGQMSMRVDDDTYLMSDENLTLSSLKAEDFKLYDMSTGDLGALMRSRKDINAVVFACTETSVRFSKDAESMTPALDDLAQIIGPDVRIAESGGYKDLLAALKDRHGCFVRGAGMIGIGSSIEEAIAAVRILEKSCEAEIFGEKLGGLQYLEPSATKTLGDFYNRNYSKINQASHVEFVNISEQEFNMRNQIIECGKKMCWSDLVQGSWGNISLRLDDHRMLITPSGMDYFEIKTEDIVKLELDDLDPGKQRKPSSEAGLHAGIYKAHPDCKAIIHTHSNGLSVFAAARAGFRIPEPELHDLIGDMHVSAHQMPGTPELTEAVLETLDGNHGCVIANHGAIFYGPDLSLVLQLADAIESRACNLLGFSAPIKSRDDEENEEQ